MRLEYAHLLLKVDDVQSVIEHARLEVEVALGVGRQ